jgi:hypothetical protein
MTSAEKTNEQSSHRFGTASRITTNEANSRVYTGGVSPDTHLLASSQDQKNKQETEQKVTKRHNLPKQ